MSDNYHEAEQAVIGGLLIDNAKIAEIDLTPLDFCDAQLAQVFGAIRRLEQKNCPFDVHTITDELNRMTGKDWTVTIAVIARNTFSAKNVKVYAEHVKRYRRNRDARAIAQELIDGINTNEDAIDTAISNLMELNVGHRKNVYHISDALKEAVDHVDRVYRNGGKTTGISTGLEDLDAALGGWQDTDLVVIGARPAMGKTALLLNCLLSAKVPATVFSAEMSAMQLALRSISIRGLVDSRKVRTADLDEDDWIKFTNAVALLKEEQIVIDATTSPTIGQVQQSARKIRHEIQSEIVFVDYIQKIRGSNSRASRIDQVSEVVQGLKNLGKELGCPVVALAQVNREVEKRNDKRPLMGDLANSSEIEKEADTIIMLYRDDVYNSDSPHRSVAELNVEKNRHGPIGEVRTTWIPSHMRFADITVEWHNQKPKEATQ